MFLLFGYDAFNGGSKFNALLTSKIRSFGTFETKKVRVSNLG